MFHLIPAGPIFVVIHSQRSRQKVIRDASEDVLAGESDDRRGVSLRRPILNQGANDPSLVSRRINRVVEKDQEGNLELLKELRLDERFSAACPAHWLHAHTCGGELSAIEMFHH